MTTHGIQESSALHIKHNNYEHTDPSKNIDTETILLARNNEIKQLYDMMTMGTGQELEQTTERCPKCAECKICKQLKDKNGTSLQAEQQYIKNCVKFNEQEGKFYAKLPWKIDPSLLQGNKSIAEKSHAQAKQKAYKTPEYPVMAKEAHDTN